MKTLLLLILISFSAHADLSLTTPVNVSSEQVSSIVVTKINLDIENSRMDVFYNELNASAVKLANKGLALVGTDYDDVVQVNPNQTISIKTNIRKLVLEKIKTKRGLSGTVN